MAHQKTIEVIAATVLLAAIASVASYTFHIANAQSNMTSAGGAKNMTTGSNMTGATGNTTAATGNTTAATGNTTAAHGSSIPTTKTAGYSPYPYHVEKARPHPPPEFNPPSTK